MSLTVFFFFSFFAYLPTIVSFCFWTDCTGQIASVLIPVVGGADSLSLILDVYQFHYLSLSFAVKKKLKKKKKKKKKGQEKNTV
jgi:hypothetical protein